MTKDDANSNTTLVSINPRNGEMMSWLVTYSNTTLVSINPYIY